MEPGTHSRLETHSPLEWGAATGGAALALAIAVVLTQFGAAAGLSLHEPFLADGSASWSVFLAGLWVMLVAIASTAAGGYLAGRLRARVGDAKPDEAEFRDGAHGLVVWAVATLVAVLVAAALASPALQAASDIEPTAAQARIIANAGAIFGFASVAAAAISAAAAWFAAIEGGKHRDEGLSVDVAVPRWLRKAR